jgi:hypothetical protein
MFLPVIVALQEIPAVVEIEGRAQQFFQVEPVVDIVVVKKDDVFEAQGLNSLPDIAGKTPVVEIVDGIKGPVGGESVNGFNEGCGIEFPHIGIDGPDLFAIAFDDVDVLLDTRCLFPGEEGLPVDGDIDIEYPVVFGEISSDVLTVAADLIIPGLEANDNDIFSFQDRWVVISFMGIAGIMNANGAGLVGM